MRSLLLSTLAALAFTGLGCSDDLTVPTPSGFGGTGSTTSSSASTNATGSGGAGGGDTTDGTGGGLLTGTGGGVGVTTGGGGIDCSVAAKLIYVLSKENDLYSFNPPDKVFKKIGPLGCKTTMTPNSMAVDRNAVAYVNYVERDAQTGKDTAGAIFKVSTDDASCQPMDIKLIDGWYRLGMGFSTDAAAGTTEKLFVAGTATANSSSHGLGQIDLTSNTLVPIGSFDGALAGKNAELTGNGNAHLFGFFVTNPVQVAEIDKTSGKILTTTALPAVPTPNSWAFSFWGGDFFLYTATPTSPSSNVNRYRPSDGTTDPAYMTDIGFTIVGAGVSTCAPVDIPK